MRKTRLSCLLPILALVGFGLATSAFAQVTLTGTNYTENFNGILSGLPAGWTVRTGSTPSSLGTAGTFTTTAANWSASGGAFENLASTISNPGTNFNGLESPATQSAATNRCLAVRQTGAFGDPGAAFVFQLQNTFGYGSFQMTLDFNLLNGQTRTNIWAVEYGLGSSPTSFTQVGTTYTTAETFGATTKTFTFPAAIDNQNQNVWIRIVTLVASTGSGSRDNFGIDNFNLSYSTSTGTAPSISVPPQNVTTNDGSNASFSVTATGTTPFRYQWLFNSNSISAATNSSLTLTAVTFSNAGPYSVIVSNDYGSITSTVAQLTVNAVAPSITTQPQNQFQVLTSNVTFSVGAAGSSPFSYQWAKDGTNVAWGTAASLTVTNIAASDAGSYLCVVTNVAGSVTSQPAALTISASTVTLMTYNVKGNGVGDFSTNTAQVQALGRQVMYLNPDIITFNEIPLQQTSEITNFVKQYLPGYNYATNSGSDGFIHNVILSRWAITRSQTWLHSSDLSNYGYTNSTFTRDLFEAQIVVPGFSLPLHVFTAHLKSGSDSDSCAKRAAEAGAISNFFVTSFLSSNATHPYVLTGDLNEDINRPPGPSQSPIQKLANPSTGLDLTTPTNPIDGDEESFSIQSLPLAHRYDYIMPSDSLYATIQSSMVFRTDLLSPTPDGLLATDDATTSDHLPVVMVFSNPNNAVPSIIANPSSRTNKAGTTATFTVQAGGAAPLTYQWQKNGTNLTDGGNISGSTNATLTMSSVLAADAGSFTCTITNLLGSTNTTAASLVVIDPAILTQPTSQTNIQGATVTFTATAGGTASLTYQWKKGGANLTDVGNIFGSSTTSLTISNLAAGDAASYSLLVSNSVGTALSSTAALTVLTPPAITTQPTSRTNNPATTATFTVAASGGSLSYRWSKNGTPLSDGGNISGSTATTLTITNVFGADAGTYSVLVSNASSTITSSNAVLTVNDPLISAQPRDVGLIAGGTAIFNVTASGTQPLGYRWQKNGVNLIEGGSINGSTTASLTVSGAQISDIGNYSVVVTNTAGSVSSSSAALQILTVQGEIVLNSSGYSQNFDGMGSLSNLPPGWLMSPAGAATPTFGATGNTNGVSQAVSSGSPTTGGRYNWGNSTNTNDRAIGFITSGGYASPNSIMPGFYNATGSNIVALSLSFDYERYRINQTAPSITFFLSLDGTNWTAYSAGDSGTFDTSPSSAYTFTGGTVVSKSFSIAGLHISNNSRFYLRWNFVTGGSNSEGLGLDNVSLAATLGNPPSITAPPQDQTVEFGTTASFSVTADGSAPLYYQWRKGGVALSDGGNIVGATSTTLTVSNVALSDTGTYDVVVTNFVGSITSSVAQLSLTNGAAITSQPVSLTNNPGSTAVFSVTATGTDPLVYKWRKNGTNLVSGGNITGANTSSLTLNNLAASDAGGYSVVVTNAAGLALSSTATLTITAPPAITTQPVSQTVWESTNVSLSVAVTGTAPFSYQWFFEGNPLSGQTNAMLNLSNVTTNQSGSYFVNITNVAGTTNSTAAVVTVKSPIIASIGYLRSLVDNLDWLPIDTTNIYRVEGTVITHTNISGNADASFYIQDNTAGINVFFTGGSAFRPQAGDNVRVTGRLTHFNGLLEMTLTAGNPTVGAIILTSGNALPSAQFVALSSQTNTALMESLEGSRIVVSNVLIDLSSSTFAVNTTIKVTNANNLAETMDMRIDARVGDFQGKVKPTYEVTIIGVLGQFDSSNPRTTGYQIIPTRFADIQQSMATIVGQPLSITNKAGSTATFTVSGAGGSLGYQWLKGTNVLVDGGNINGATSSTLMVNGVLRADEGVYSVIISNGASSVISSAATLTVIDPAISAQPTNTFVNLGANTLLSVGAAGTGPLKYQWFFKTSAVKNATNSTLLLTNSTATMAGTYFAVVTNIYGKATSSVATLTVVTPPSFSSPLIPIVFKPKAIVPAGTRVMMNTTFKGTSPAYQWNHNDSPTGPTTATNIIDAVTLGDGGNYSVTMSNSAGVVTSIDMPLTVFADTNIPTVAISKPAGSSIYLLSTNDGHILAFGSASDNAKVTNVYYRLSQGTNIGAWTAVTNFTPKDANSLTATWTNNLNAFVGTNVLETYAIDWSGNTSKVAKAVFFFHVPSPLTVTVNEHDTRAGEGTDSAWPADYRATKPSATMVQAPDTFPTNGATLYVNRGLYTLTALPGHNQIFSNWVMRTASTTNYVGVPKLTFDMQTNLNLEANFIHNPWMEAQGSYFGLCTNGSLDNGISGFFTVKISTNQSYSGKVLVDGDSISISGKLNTDGTQQLTLSRAKLGKRPLYLSITNLFGSAGDSGTNTIVGTLTDSNGLTASITADQWIYTKTNSPTVGQFTMIVPGALDATLAPGGNGWGSITVDGLGKVVEAGSLADGTALTPQVAYISKTGRWPMFNQIYATKMRVVDYVNDQVFHTNSTFLGVYMGWVNLTNPTPGTLRWTKFPITVASNVIVAPTGSYTNAYAGGFSLDIPLTTRSYAQRGATTRLIDVTNALISFEDGLLGGTQSAAVQLRTNNTVGIWGPVKVVTKVTNNITHVVTSITNFPLQVTTIGTNTALGKLAVAFDQKTGKMSGSFTNAVSLLPTGAPKTIAFTGVVLQPDNVAYGFFLGGTNQSGAVSFAADPNNP